MQKHSFLVQGGSQQFYRDPSLEKTKELNGQKVSESYLLIIGSQINAASFGLRPPNEGGEVGAKDPCHNPLYIF